MGPGTWSTVVAAASEGDTPHRNPCWAFSVAATSSLAGSPGWPAQAAARSPEPATPPPERKSSVVQSHSGTVWPARGERALPSVPWTGCGRAPRRLSWVCVRGGPARGGEVALQAGHRARVPEGLWQGAQDGGGGAIGVDESLMGPRGSAPLVSSAGAMRLATLACRPTVAGDRRQIRFPSWAPPRVHPRPRCRDDLLSWPRVSPGVWTATLSSEPLGPAHLLSYLGPRGRPCQLRGPRWGESPSRLTAGQPGALSADAPPFGPAALPAGPASRDLVPTAGSTSQTTEQSPLCAESLPRLPRGHRCRPRCPCPGRRGERPEPSRTPVSGICWVPWEWRCSLLPTSVLAPRGSFLTVSWGEHWPRGRCRVGARGPCAHRSRGLASGQRAGLRQPPSSDPAASGASDLGLAAPSWAPLATSSSPAAVPHPFPRGRAPRGHSGPWRSPLYIRDFHLQRPISLPQRQTRDPWEEDPAGQGDGHCPLERMDLTFSRGPST
ncbi:uncharacterized protein LOC115292527 [Suricata suricatta]|uniref:uncharacterized protein LOC115292527 n=1 Tax=Suricata suricatta TaxID=37032 RepID=UPI00115545D1|nr:uncharacterized protein LOC115292527 [Suricata suricatta]